MNVNQRRALHEAINKLEDMPADGDSEILHGVAEKILCDYLIEVGAKELADAFDDANDRVGFWYA